MSKRIKLVFSKGQELLALMYFFKGITDYIYIHIKKIKKKLKIGRDARSKKMDC